MENKTRVFGDKDDVSFWIDKPIQKRHPKYVEKTKWYHIHFYNKPYNPIHKNVDGTISETMKVTLYKCRCGKCV